MYLLSKSLRFEAAHRLPHHDGKCRRLHGHSFQMTVEVCGPNLQTTGPQTGMGVDFGVIAEPIRVLVDGCLDHHYLNDSTGLTSPTSEALAHWVFHRLQPVIDDNAYGYHMTAVTVAETCTSTATYRPVDTPVTRRRSRPPA
jgi:6-pyruvoyltetrahydropterin/6-carboxytetrahydropterin synthase